MNLVGILKQVSWKALRLIFSVSFSGGPENKQPTSKHHAFFFFCTDAWDEQVLNCLFIAEKGNVLF